jgi:uncharacterized protein (TIGR03067 family)
VKRTLPGVAALLCLVAIETQAAQTSDKDKLQGTWGLTSVMVGGKKIDVPEGQKPTLIFKGDKFSMNSPGNDHEGTFKIDEKKKEIDLTAPKDPKNPKELETVQGVYKVEGDALTLAYTEPGKPRPKGFDDKEAFIMTFKKK